MKRGQRQISAGFSLGEIAAWYVLVVGVAGAAGYVTGFAMATVCCMLAAFAWALVSSGTVTGSLGQWVRGRLSLEL